MRSSILNRLPGPSYMNATVYFRNTYCPVPSGSFFWYLHRYISVPIAYPLYYFFILLANKSPTSGGIFEKLAVIIYPVTSLTVTTALTSGIIIGAFRLLTRFSPETATLIGTHFTETLRVTQLHISTTSLPVLLATTVFISHMVFVLYHVPITRMSRIHSLYLSLFRFNVTKTTVVFYLFSITIATYIAATLFTPALFIATVVTWTATQGIGKQIKDDMYNQQNIDHYRAEWWIILTRSIFVATTTYWIAGGNPQLTGVLYTTVILVAFSFRVYRTYHITDHTTNTVEPTTSLRSYSDVYSYRHTPRKTLLNRMKQNGKTLPNDTMDMLKQTHTALSHPNTISQFIHTLPNGDFTSRTDIHPVTKRDLAGEKAGTFPTIPSLTSLILQKTLFKHTDSPSYDYSTESMTRKTEQRHENTTSSDETGSDTGFKNNAMAHKYSPSPTSSKNTSMQNTTGKHSSDDIAAQWGLDVETESKEKRLLSDLTLALHEVEDEFPEYTTMIEEIDMDSLETTAHESWGVNEVILVRSALQVIQDQESLHVPAVTRALEKADTLLEHWDVDPEKY